MRKTMDSAQNSPDAHVSPYVQELIQMLRASQERMQALEENNKQMMETISQLANPQPNLIGSFPTQPTSLIENLIVHPTFHHGDPTGSENVGNGHVLNTNENGDNGLEAPNVTADPLVTTFSPPSSTTNTFVAMGELQKLLEQKNKSLNFSEFDLKLSYPVRVAAKPYPKDYTCPKFKQFNGKTRDAREHVMKFVETLGVAELDDDLNLKEFSKSLTEKAYTWNVNLTPSLVESWSHMFKMFGEKYFSTQEKVTLIDLGRDHQKSREDLMEYIQRFKEKVLDIQDSHDEKELVKVCIQGMFDEYRVHLENLPLPTFTTLVEAVRRTNNTVLR